VGSDGASKGDSNGLSEKFLGLSNDILQVKSLQPDLIEFRHTSETKSFLGTKKKSFEARAKLDPAKRKVNYWQTVDGGGAGQGFGGESDYAAAGNRVRFSSFVVKDADRSGSGVGFSPDGDRFKYDFGKVRDIVEAIAEEGGWKVGNALSKPSYLQQRNRASLRNPVSFVS